MYTDGLPRIYQAIKLAWFPIYAIIASIRSYSFPYSKLDEEEPIVPQTTLQIIVADISKMALTALAIAITPLRILLEPVHILQSAFFDYETYTNQFERRTIASFAMVAIFSTVASVCGFSIYQNVQYQRKETTTSEAQVAFERKDYALALFHYKKLASLKKLNQKERFQQALSLFHTGNLRRGVQMLRQLTAKNTAGYEPAHRFMATWLTKGVINNSDLPEIEYHLKNSGRPTPKTWEATGKYFLAIDKTEEAIAALRKSVKQFPSNHLLVSKALLKAGQKQESSKELLRAEKIIYTKLKTLSEEKSPTSNEEAVKYKRLLDKIKTLRKKTLHEILDNPKKN